MDTSIISFGVLPVPYERTSCSKCLTCGQRLPPWPLRRSTGMLIFIVGGRDRADGVPNRTGSHPRGLALKPANMIQAPPRLVVANLRTTKGTLRSVLRNRRTLGHPCKFPGGRQRRGGIAIRDDFEIALFHPLRLYRYYCERQKVTWITARSFDHPICDKVSWVFAVAAKQRRSGVFTLRWVRREVMGMPPGLLEVCGM